LNAIDRAQLLGMLSAALLMCGDRRAWEVLRDEAKELLDRTRDTTILQIQYLGDGVSACLDGKLEEAIRVAEQLRRAGETAGRAYINPAYSLVRRPLLYLGRIEEALAAVPSTSFLSAAGAYPSLAALCHAHLGATESAQEIISDFVRLLKLGEPGGRQPFLPRANYGRCRQDARTVRRGSRLLGSALEVCTKVRFRPEIALIRLGLAELLLEHYPNERDTALDHLDFAIAEFQAMKMQPSLERALRHRGLLRA
jgi:hypothetical protein